MQAISLYSSLCVNTTCVHVAMKPYHTGTGKTEHGPPGSLVTSQDIKGMIRMKLKHHGQACRQSWLSLLVRDLWIRASLIPRITRRHFW